MYTSDYTDYTTEQVKAMPHNERIKLLGETVNWRMGAVLTARLDANGNDLNEGAGFLSDPVYIAARADANVLRY